MAESKGSRRYNKAPAIKSKPEMRESGGDEERSATPKREGTSNAPRPESGTGGAKPNGNAMSGTDGVETHDDEDAAGGMQAMHMRHHREMKEMHDGHHEEHKSMSERHHAEHHKMHKRHQDEHKAMMSEGEAEAATAQGSMGTTAGQ